MTEDRTKEKPVQQQEEAPPGQELDGKVIKKTYLEIREEARRAVLSSHDREKYEKMEPEDQEFVNAACLFEFNSQQVNKTKRKVKLRDMMLCRDVAAAYCPGRDMAGQYSEGKRILKNSEGGNETVKFVLARKVCSMLERVYNLYSSHPRSYVSNDLHRVETELLNYTSRLGKIIREPLGEARRIYTKLKERTGWEIPASAFGNAEGCDVPQLFFNRYSDPNQLLLKDPMKPFRSDNMEPPLKLDYRIKNAVLVMAGENRFHIDKKRFDSIRDSATARAIMLKGLQESRKKISEAYGKDIHELAEGFRDGEEINVTAIKEASFNFFYSYTLTSLPNTAARIDAAELFVLKLMEEENDCGCHGFCKYVYPPSAVDDDSSPDSWSPSCTRAYKLRQLFHEVGTGQARLSMFAMKLTELLTEYLDKELNRIKKAKAEPFSFKIKARMREIEKFLEENREALAEHAEAEESLRLLGETRESMIDEVLELIRQVFHKNLEADTVERKLEMLHNLLPRLEKEAAKRDELIGKCKGRYQALVGRNNQLTAAIKRYDDSGGAEAEAELRELASAGDNGGQAVAGASKVRALAVAQLEKIRTALAKVKKQHAAALKIQKPLREIINTIRDLDEMSHEISRARDKKLEFERVVERKRELAAGLDQLRSERDEQLSKIEDMIEVNQES